MAVESPYKGEILAIPLKFNETRLYSQVREMTTVNITGRTLPAWIRLIPPQVLHLLRVSRSEEVRKYVVLTLAPPLYEGWGNVEALAEMWSFIAGADEESVEFRLSLLCILAKDLLGSLALPLEQPKQFWDLMFREYRVLVVSGRPLASPGPKM